MNWKTMGLTTVAALTLSACGTNGNGQDLGQGSINENVQEMRYNSVGENYADYYQNTRYGNTPARYNPGADGVTNRGDFANPDSDYNPGINADNTDEHLDFGNTRGIDTRDNRYQENVNVRNNNDQNINNQRLNVNNDQNNFEVADRVAERITNEMNEIERVYVFTTDNNAYVAAEIDNQTNNRTTNGDVSDSLKRNISRVVKSVEKDIDNVYVSTNPDFVNLSNNYARDAQRGEPVEGFFDQMGEMIDRIFPDAK
ncbi:YhcN/YlaJ family sporulation lipoprotein [Aquibacillus salsiterrae]|uniref:YhcN/YlaJ family sporulation lipoprotein n=1 Tax=Aquibacillus salsiterrae TaxID=2950439 RepID=A0A9X3WDK4_9BACI|nr:YhcN/YlaJ family sporulation lipoprotein [Aquibacillus salsiterrae]MDC3417687.1 YhcN/YlaJ family sporulation lipoprotein [Aquibacillus salsiterrae]